MKIFSKKHTLLYLIPHKITHNLNPEQLQMYKLERETNFRWISKLLATYSPYVLSKDDMVDMQLHTELAEIGQFAELAYSTTPINQVFENAKKLTRTGFPLEKYDTIPESTLCTAFHGTAAHLTAYVAYRPQTKQLVLAISGTTSLEHAWFDISAIRRRHPSGRGSVHRGFWRLYQGIKSQAVEAIKDGLHTREVDELIVTGHSMGGAIAYLLVLDLLAEPTLTRPGIRLKLVAYGAPRCGDAKLMKYWRELVSDYRVEHGVDSFTEYMIKAYNDGVPALPPLKFGYRHFTSSPLYFIWGRLYRIPPSESECCLFMLKPDCLDSDLVPEHPLGGHNYYSGRDLEMFRRQMKWLNIVMSGKEDWEERYHTYLVKHENR